MRRTSLDDLIEELFVECCELVEEYQEKVKRGIVPDVKLDGTFLDERQATLHKWH